MGAREGSVRQRHSAACRRRSQPDGCKCSWSFRFRDYHGKQKERTGFATKRAAETGLRDVLGKVDRGTYREPKRIGFEDFAERWLGTIEDAVKPATLVSYQGSVRNHLVPYFGQAQLSKITREHVDTFMADKLAAKNGKGKRQWSPKTLANVLMVLKRLLGAGVDWDYLAVNPAERVKPPRGEGIERDAFSWQEIERVLAVAGDPWALIFRMAALTTMRRGELLGLRWSDVELDAGRLFVRQSYGQYGFGSPKSRAGRRMIPLTPDFVRELRRYKLASVPNAHGLVFVSQAGTPLDPDNVTRAWDRSVRKAGLRHLSFHSLRHSAVSFLIEHERLNPKQLQTVVGHSSIQLTYDTYGHLMPDSFDGFGEGLDGLGSDSAPTDKPKVETATAAHTSLRGEGTAEGTALMLSRSRDI